GRGRGVPQQGHGRAPGRGGGADHAGTGMRRPRSPRAATFWLVAVGGGLALVSALPAWSAAPSGGEHVFSSRSDATDSGGSAVSALSALATALGLVALAGALTLLLAGPVLRRVLAVALL